MTKVAPSPPACSPFDGEFFWTLLVKLCEVDIPGEGSALPLHAVHAIELGWFFWPVRLAERSFLQYPKGERSFLDSARLIYPPLVSFFLDSGSSQVAAARPTAPSSPPAAAAVPARHSVESSQCPRTKALKAAQPWGRSSTSRHFFATILIMMTFLSRAVQKYKLQKECNIEDDNSDICRPVSVATKSGPSSGRSSGMKVIFKLFCYPFYVSIFVDAVTAMKIYCQFYDVC